MNPAQTALLTFALLIPAAGLAAPGEVAASTAGSLAAEGLALGRCAKRRKRRKKRRRKKPRPKKAPPAAEAAAGPEASGAGPTAGGEAAPTLRRSNRMDFDARLVQGEKASGAVYLFQRVPRRLPRLLEMKQSYIDRIVAPVLRRHIEAAPQITAQPKKRKRRSPRRGRRRGAKALKKK